MLQGCHLVEDAPHGPEVGLVIVRVVLPDLRAQVVRGAHTGPGIIRRPVHDPGDSEISEFYCSVFSEKNVLRFDVSM